MSIHSPATHRARPLKQVGILCLGWTGTVMFVVGLIVLGKDVYAWLIYGGRLDLMLTSVFEILSPLLSHTASHLGGLVEFSRLAPLSLVLIVLGWCIHQLAKVNWHMAQEMAKSDSRHGLIGEDQPSLVANRLYPLYSSLAHRPLLNFRPMRIAIAA